MHLLLFTFPNKLLWVTQHLLLELGGWGVIAFLAPRVEELKEMTQWLGMEGILVASGLGDLTDYYFLQTILQIFTDSLPVQ